MEALGDMISKYLVMIMESNRKLARSSAGVLRRAMLSFSFSGIAVRRVSASFILIFFAGGFSIDRVFGF
jgi:hypothetical protein